MTKRYSDNDEFDARMRALLRGLPVAEESAVPLPRRRFLRSGLALAASVAGLGVGGWTAWQVFSAPHLVRAAFAHAQEEAEVRGIHARDFAAAQSAVGANANHALPGVLQLCKDCTIAERPAWHMNVYLDYGGYVHLFAFHNTPPVTDVEGRALDGHWRFFTSRAGITVLALAQSPHALGTVTRTLST